MGLLSSIVNQIKAAEVLPDGTYECVVKKAAIKLAKSGRSMLHIELRPNVEGAQLVFHNICLPLADEISLVSGEMTETAAVMLRQLKQFADALGMTADFITEEVGEDGSLTGYSLQQSPAGESCKVKLIAAEDGQFGARNEVKSFIKA